MSAPLDRLLEPGGIDMVGVQGEDAIDEGPREINSEWRSDRGIG